MLRKREVERNVDREIGILGLEGGRVIPLREMWVRGEVGRSWLRGRFALVSESLLGGLDRAWGVFACNMCAPKVCLVGGMWRCRVMFV